MSVLQQTVSLAAQLRAFSSLLSLPSQAQSVIKAFRRQGIGFADVFNTARFLLSRLESLSAAPSSLSFLRFRSKSSKSSEACRARLCLPCQPSSSRLFAPPYRRQPLQPQTRHPSHQRWYVLQLSYSKCQWRKDPHLPSHPHPSATCRALRACLLWHLWPVSASAYADAKTVPKHHRPRMTDVRQKAPADSDRHRTPERNHRRDIYKQCDRSPDRTSFEIPLNHL